MTEATVQQRVSMRSVAIALALLVSALVFSPFNSGRTAQGPAISQAVSQFLAAHPGQPVQVIVTARGNAAPLESAVRASGGKVKYDYGTVNSFAATVPSTMVDRLNHDAAVKGLTVDSPVKWQGAVSSTTLLNRYDTLSRVPSVAWNGKNLDGTGVQVAVIDTGVWPHNDLVQPSPSVPGNGGNRLISLYTNPLATDPLDHYGHGTHVAGIIAGNGYDSTGQYIGVAPNSMIVSVKVSNDLGNATEGDVIAGLDWVYQANRHGMQIRVVNLSVTSTVAQSYHQSALDAMVEKLWFTGVVVVVSAGNNGSAPIYAPANDPFVVTVGSIDDQYQTTLAGSIMAPWSNYGLTQDNIRKPEVVADGSHVVSLLAPASYLSLNHSGNVVGTSYFKMGGTSMAAPEVAGMVALMLQANPNQNNEKVKRELETATVPFGTTAYTPWLGTNGGFLDASAIGKVADQDANAGDAVSEDFNPGTGAILAGGAVWTDAQWANAAWNNTSWANTSWANTSWANTSWAGVGTSAPTLTSSVWNATSWANTSWANTNLDNTSWANTSWANTSWANTSWANTSWANTSWANTSWANTSWANTSWASIQWSNTSWANTSWADAVFE